MPIAFPTNAIMSRGERLGERSSSRDTLDEKPDHEAIADREERPDETRCLASFERERGKHGRDRKEQNPHPDRALMRAVPQARRLVARLCYRRIPTQQYAIARPATYPWYPLAPSWIRQLSGPLKYS
jgi:hypothetical protein